MCESDIFTNNNGSKFNFNLNVLHHPTWMQTTILPQKTKQRVSEKILAHLEYLDQTQVKNYDYHHYVDVWKNAMTMMNSRDDSKIIPLFFKETQKLDAIRNEDFRILFPELYRDFIDYEQSRI
jgi:hypothetical protein